MIKREDILNQVRQYYREHHQRPEYRPGDRIDYAGRVYDEAEMVNLVDAALDFRLTADRYAEAFEQKLAGYLGVPFASAVNSGSSANLLAMSALTSPLLGDRRILPGDEVITVAAAFPTTVAPILQVGAKPVFIDVALPGYNADADKLEAAVSGRTKAVFLAHTMGNMFDAGRILDFCRAHGLWLIEDACDALGGEWTGNAGEEWTAETDGARAANAGGRRMLGALGDIGTASFYPAHQITTGEGGAVFTSDPLLHRILRSMRDWGRDCICGPGQDNACGHRFEGQYGSLPEGYDHKYVYSHFGYNFKMTDLQAAIGCAQMEKLPAFARARRENWRYLREALADLDDLLILPEAQEGSDPAWFGFLMTVKDGAARSRDEMVRTLEEQGIQTRHLFAGNITRHPCFDGLREGEDYRICGGLAVTDQVMRSSFWVGVYPGMTAQKLQVMADGIRRAAGR